MSVVLFNRIEVEDYETWRVTYDEYDAMRQEHGQQSAQVFRDLDNPNVVTLVAYWGSPDQAMAFRDAVDLDAIQQQAGVIQTLAMAAMSQA